MVAPTQFTHYTVHLGGGGGGGGVLLHNTPQQPLTLGGVGGGGVLLNSSFSHMELLMHAQIYLGLTVQTCGRLTTFKQNNFWLLG